MDTNAVGQTAKCCEVDSDEWSLLLDTSWPTLLNDELEPALGVEEPVTVLSPSVRWDLSSASRRPEGIILIGSFRNSSKCSPRSVASRFCFLEREDFLFLESLISQWDLPIFGATIFEPDLKIDEERSPLDSYVRFQSIALLLRGAHDKCRCYLSIFSLSLHRFPIGRSNVLRYVHLFLRARRPLSSLVMQKTESRQIIHLEHHLSTWIDHLSALNWLLSGSVLMIYRSMCGVIWSSVNIGIAVRVESHVDVLLSY